ncbi:MAG: hypothetical protein JKY52_09270 [Flavobacteriales bacterium]|nr:hypothetical protein [Flavobacteriales bacterium]
MAFTQIAGDALQYIENNIAAVDAYIKLYASETTTPISMSTDSTGGTLLAKAKVNSQGRAVNGSDAVFVPHIDQKYRFVLYPNATDADNNTFGNALYDIDKIFPFLTTQQFGFVKDFPTLALAVSDAALDDGDVLDIAERATGIGGGGKWNVVLSSTVTENTFTVVQCTGVATLSLVLRKVSGSVDLIAAGGDPGNVTFINSAWIAAMELFSDGKGGKLIIPPGEYLIEPTFRAAGDLAKQIEFPYDNVEVELRGCTLNVDSHDNRYMAILFGRKRGSTSTTPNRVSNISLTGTGTIKGERSTHSPVDTNYGFGIFIANCQDSNITTPTVLDVFGDGIMIDALPYGPADGDNNNDSTCINVNIYGGLIKNNFRNNVSILNNKGIDFWGTVADGANGGSPQAGFDVEPDFFQVSGDFICERVGLHGVKSINNLGSGIEIVDTSPGRIDSVTITAPYVKNCGTSSNGFGGIRVVSPDGTGSVTITSAEVLECFGVGIDIDGAGSGSQASARRIKVIAPFVKGILEGTKEGTTLGHGIGVRNGVRGVDIINPTVELCARQGIYVNGNGDGTTAATGVSDINITLPNVYANSQVTDDTYDNILINLGCQNVSVHGGTIRKDHPTETTTNQPKYGVNVLSNECHVLDADVLASGATGDLNAPFEKIVDTIAGRDCIIRPLAGYKNACAVLSGVQNVDGTGTFSVAIAHNLDTLALATPSLLDDIASQIRVTMIDEGTLTGDPVVVTRVVSIDATNINVKFTVVTAGSGGDQMRVSATVNPPVI